MFKKYKDIDIFIVVNKPITQKVQIKPVEYIKFDLNDLNKLKVCLKELCIKHKIIMKRGSIRNDYVNALLNYTNLHD